MNAGAPPNAAACSEEFEFSALTVANNYRQAIIGIFGATLQGDIIELGAGIGQLAELVEKLDRVTSFLAVEPDERYATRFAGRLPNVSLHRGLLSSLPEPTHCDVIFSVNVFEHIEQDFEEMKLCRKILAPRGGALCLLVPARPELYSPIDKDFGHFRRYTRSELKEKIEKAGFQVERLEYFSLVGYFTWLLNFKILKARSFDVRKLAYFDKFIFPIANKIESLVGPPPFGQSLIAICRSQAK